jgi:hypothetical protein
MAASIAKQLMSPRLRHLARTEINLLRDDGLGKSARYNWMLADAWLRDRVNRRHYPHLDQEAASRLRKSDTVFIFGSGYSLNEITDGEWRHMVSHDTFGFNAFYHQRWIDVNFHLLRGGLYGELRWQGFAREVVDIIAANPRFRDTVFVMQGEFLAQFTNQLIGYRLFPPAKGILRYPTNRDDGRLPSRQIAHGLRHIAGTLSDAVNCAFCLGWKHIVLVGVDLYDSRYFYLPPDQTATVDRERATVTGGPVNRLGGNRVGDLHYTLRNGVVELMEEWQQYFATFGVQMSVYNPRSLLAGVLPVYSSNRAA